MEIKELAEKYGAKTRLDSCGDTVIPGKPRKAARAEDRMHIYENGDGRLGVCIMHRSIRAFNYAGERLVDAGLIRGQHGDSEGTFLFDPTSAQQSKAAMKASEILRV